MTIPSSSWPNTSGAASTQAPLAMHLSWSTAICMVPTPLWTIIFQSPGGHDRDRDRTAQQEALAVVDRAGDLVVRQQVEQPVQPDLGLQPDQVEPEADVHP